MKKKYIRLHENQYENIFYKLEILSLLEKINLVKLGKPNIKQFKHTYMC